MHISTISLNLAKHGFQIHGVDAAPESGATASSHRRLRRCPAPAWSRLAASRIPRSERGIPSLQRIRQRIHPEDRATAAEILGKAIREGKGYELDYRIVFPEGIVKFLHLVAHPVFNTSGDPVEFVGTVMDVTERKRAEEALRQSESYLAEAQS